MLKIAICDDVVEIVKELKNMIKKIEKKHSIDLITYEFFSGAALLEDMSDGNSFDLIFLDIEMDKINGVEVGLAIRNKIKDDNIQIAYISGKTNYAMELFQVRPIDFLVKPLNIEKVEEVILTTLRLVDVKHSYFKYKKRQTYKKIEIKDILYFESDSRKINIVTSNNGDSFYGRTDDVFEEVKDLGFIYIHKSYIVNTQYIKSYKYDEITMSNDVILTISQSRRNAIRNNLLKAMN